MLLNKTTHKKININNKYNNNIIWGYIDIYKGNIILYSPQMCNKIEYNYKNNKSFINIDFLNTTIYFKDKLKQITDNKKYSVFRLITNNNYIEKNLFIKNDKYYEYNKQNHIGLLLNNNITDFNNYKNIVSNIIFKHKTEFSNNRFYSYNRYINIHNNTNLKNISNLDNLFDIYYETNIENTPSDFDNTIYCQFVNLLLHICQNCYDNECIHIYTLTTSQEFKVIEDISHTLKKKNFLNNNWHIISLIDIIEESNINYLEYNII